jgi:hypothetical protein
LIGPVYGGLEYNSDEAFKVVLTYSF